MTCYNSEMKSVKEVLEEMQEEKNKYKELRQKILNELQKLDSVKIDKYTSELDTFCKDFNCYSNKPLVLGEYTLTFIS